MMIKLFSVVLHHKNVIKKQKQSHNISQATITKYIKVCSCAPPHISVMFAHQVSSPDTPRWC